MKTLYCLILASLLAFSLPAFAYNGVNAVITPFTFADVQGLAAAIENAETPEYQELLKLIGEINAATTVSAVRAIVWP